LRHSDGQRYQPRVRRHTQLENLEGCDRIGPPRAPRQSVEFIVVTNCFASGIKLTSR
jgi:hypothetical protein